MNSRLLTFSLLLILCIGSQASAGQIEIASGNGLQAPRQPQAAVSNDGTIHLVYGIGDSVYFARSKDSGATFQPPEKAFDCTNMSLGMRRGPRVAVSGDAVVVTAVGGAMGKGRDGDILAWRRSSNGPWTGPIRVNDVADSGREGLHAMAGGPDGSLWCCWLDLRIKGTQIYGAKSTDGGQTWSKNFLIYQSPDGTVCQCCHPSIAVDAHGRPHVMFRNVLNGDRDMYVVSGDSDGTFGTAVKLGGASWSLDRCPMEGGMLAVDAKGRVFTAWLRKQDVFLTNNGQEQHLGRGEQPWVAALKDGPVAVWIEKDDGKLFVSTPNATTPAVLTDIARDPVVVPLADGKKAFVAWEKVVDKDRTIVAEVVE